MKEEIARHILPWARVWTWHTSHQLDRARFFEALESLHHATSGDILRCEFKDALKEVTAGTPETLDGPQPEALFDRLTDQAIGILEYLRFKDQRNT